MLVATRFLLLRAAVLALPAVCCLTLGLPEAQGQTACTAADSNTACGDVLFIGVHGSNEGTDSPTIVKTCESFEKEALKKGRKIDVELLDYTAPDWDSLADLINCKAASNEAICNSPALDLKDQGRDALDISIQNALTKCPMRGIVLTGYSFGSWIIDDWLSRSEKTDLPRIRAVQLYGDPLWREAAPGANGSRRASVYQGIVRRVPGLAVNPDPYMSNPIGPPDLGDRWQSYCLVDDPVCGRGYESDGLIPIRLSDQVGKAKECRDKPCIHKQYAPGATWAGLTDGGGQFLAGKAFPLAGEPEVIQVDTFREGEHVFFSLLYSDPGNAVAGFGFRGVKGAGWAEERHTFGDQGYARVSPGKIEYPFNHVCESGPAYESDVEVWLQNSAGGQITQTVTVHLACSAPMFVILGPAPQPGGVGIAR